MHVVNLDEYEWIGTHWVSLYVNGNSVKHIRKEITKFVGNKNIITNIFRTQAYASIMRGYFCIGFDFMFKGKTVT